MGVINVTPDSFSGDGLGPDVEAAVAQGERFAAQGVDILDIGGESTRPGAEPVPVEEEIARVVPVIEQLAKRVRVPLSIDTYHAATARAALEAGAHLVNDITGLRGDPKMAAVVAQFDVPVVIMHIQGTPRTMQQNPTYEDVIADIRRYWEEGIDLAVRAGINPEKIIVDPGIGFGKTVGHNLEILRRLRELTALGRPILVGTSRKSFIGKVLDLPVDQRLEGTAASVALAIANGADLVRVHDIPAMIRVARMADAIVRGWKEPKRVYLGLGSNLGDRLTYLRQAVAALEAEPGIEVRRRSSVYETAPVGYAEQPDFLNAVVEIATSLSPRALLQVTQRIEQNLGRKRGGSRWGPRCIDLDLLLYEGVTVQEADLTLPHPRLTERAFVLVPLAEIAPDLPLPDGRTAQQAAKEEQTHADLRLQSQGPEW